MQADIHCAKKKKKERKKETKFVEFEPT